MRSGSGTGQRQTIGFSERLEVDFNRSERPSEMSEIPVDVKIVKDNVHVSRASSPKK